MTDDISLDELDKRLARIRESGGRASAVHAPDDISEAELDRQIGEITGRVPKRMSADEAAFELGLAEAARRAPDPRAVEARQRVRDLQEAERDLRPWRAAVGWENRGRVAGVEETLAEVVSSRRGQTIDAAREYVNSRLREAWVKGGTTDSARLAAVAARCAEDLDHFGTLPPISGRATTSESVRTARVAIMEAIR